MCFVTVVQWRCVAIEVGGAAAAFRFWSVGGHVGMKCCGGFMRMVVVLSCVELLDMHGLCKLARRTCCNDFRVSDLDVKASTDLC